MGAAVEVTAVEGMRLRVRRAGGELTASQWSGGGDMSLAILIAVGHSGGAHHHGHPDPRRVRARRGVPVRALRRREAGRAALDHPGRRSHGAISLREIVMDVPPQEVITRDNVSVKVNAVLYFRVLHPEKAVIQVENYLYGTSQLAQTTLRSVCGQAELDELLAEREPDQPEAPGDHRPADRALGREGARGRGEADRPAPGDAARDGEAGRGGAREAREGDPRRGRVPGRPAPGRGGAGARRRRSSALQLRYLQTLSEIATENNSTIVFPVPIDILRPFYETAAGSGDARAAAADSGWRATRRSSPPTSGCSARCGGRWATRCCVLVVLGGARRLGVASAPTR